MYKTRSGTRNRMPQGQGSESYARLVSAHPPLAPPLQGWETVLGALVVGRPMTLQMGRLRRLGHAMQSVLRLRSGSDLSEVASSKVWLIAASWRAATPSDGAALRLLTRCDQFYRCNRWDPEKLFKFSHRIRDENAGRAAYCMYSAAMRAGDAPQCCGRRRGPGTPGLEMCMTDGEARGCVRKK
jgi:hypothetical protein